MFTTRHADYLLDLLARLADLLDLCVRLAVVFALSALSGFAFVAVVVPVLDFLLALVVATKETPGLWDNAAVFVVVMALVLGGLRRDRALEE